MGVKFYVHLAVAVIICVLFTVMFIKRRRADQLIIAIWAPITMLSYLSDSEMFKWILGGVELVLFLAVVFLLFKSGNKQAKSVMDEIRNQDRS